MDEMPTGELSLTYDPDTRASLLYLPGADVVLRIIGDVELPEDADLVALESGEFATASNKLIFRADACDAVGPEGAVAHGPGVYLLTAAGLARVSTSDPTSPAGDVLDDLALAVLQETRLAARAELDGAPVERITAQLVDRLALFGVPVRVLGVAPIAAVGAALDRLALRGFVEHDADAWRITPLGCATLDAF